MLKLLGFPPLSEALEAVAVVAVGHDAEPGLGALFLHHNLHADAAGLLLGPLDGKSHLHLRLVLAQTGLKTKEGHNT